MPCILKAHRRSAAVVLVLAFSLFVQVQRAAADASELHILLVIDTHAGKRGGDFDVHFKAKREILGFLDTAINEAYNGLGPKFKDRMFLTVLEGNDVSPGRIRKHFADMAYAPKRNLFFFYSGHGSFDDTHGHFFATSGGDILRSEVHTLMADTGAKGIILVSDSCSTNGSVELVKTVAQSGGTDLNALGNPATLAAGPLALFGSTALEATIAAAPAATAPRVNKQLFYDLFYRTEGVVDFTSAQRGEYSFGGLMAEALTDYLRKPSKAIRQDGKSGTVTWKDFFAKVRARTNRQFVEMKKYAPASHESKKVKAQYPQAFHLTGWPTQHRRRLVVKNDTGHKIEVRLQYYDLDFTTGKWKWFTPNSDATHYVFEPGTETGLVDSDRRIGGQRMRIWATTPDGQVQWNEFRNQDYYLTAKEGYRGPIGQHVFTFSP